MIANSLYALKRYQFDLGCVFLGVAVGLSKIFLEFKHFQEVEQLEQVHQASLLDKLIKCNPLQFLFLNQTLHLRDIVIDVTDLG